VHVAVLVLERARAGGPLDCNSRRDGTNAISCVCPVPGRDDLRIIFRQAADQRPVRTSRGAPPDGTSLGQMLLIEASQGDHNLAVHINYDRPLWSGLSWGVGEIRNRDFDRHRPVRVRCVSLDPQASDLTLQLYAVEYAKHIR
jgi:hypothetical protein